MDIEIRDIIVVGGGAAGMMAAAKAAETGCSVTLIEKNSILGRKVLITGKGRCNLTNTKKWSEFSTHIHPKSAFFKSAFYNFSNTATIEYFNNIGLPTVVEQGERVFPESMRSQDVSDILLSRLNSLGVELLYCKDVIKISKVNEEIFECSIMDSTEKVFSVRFPTISVSNIYGKAVIIATGGLSYPITGSTGAGYSFAESFGHKVNARFPSLTALIPNYYDTKLYGITLNNVGLNLFIDKDLIQMELGEVKFTEKGIEGALVYRVSRKAVKALINGQKVELILDLKPALSIDTLNKRVDRDLEKLKINSEKINTGKWKMLLRELLPVALIDPFISHNKDLTLNNLPVKLKDWRFGIKTYVGYERAAVTAGGVSQDEIISKSMKSKLVSNLYFAGEVIDLDGDTGGYNLQIAFSTGSLAGLSAAQQILKSKSKS